MEHRIKALYIITILAILAFLGMQGYWLYGRYQYSLTEAETAAYGKAIDVLDTYRNSTDPKDSSLTHQSNYNIDFSTDSVEKSQSKVTITTQRYKAHELLGIKEDRKLTQEEMSRAAKMVMDNIEAVECATQTYDVYNAPSEASVWGAFKFLGLRPDISEIDSLLTAAGLDATAETEVSDSSLWAPEFSRHARILAPSAEIIYPFSELDCLNIRVTCRFSFSEVLGGMLSSLIAVAILSTFLIVCLLLQFSTILKLSRLDRMRNGFVTTMIHELKRPLSILKMCVSGLDNPRMMADADARHELLCETRDALDTLSAYFSKMRDITFNDVTQIPLNISDVNLRALATRVMQTAPNPTHKQVNILVDIPEGLTVHADSSHLYNIMSNLVENAIKYSGDEVSVTISASETSDGVAVSVADDGIGIPASDLGHIFNRFYRGRASAGDVPGIGLGLTYVKLLTDAHGGRVAVESTPGSGTRFTINLPQR